MKKICLSILICLFMQIIHGKGFEVTVISQNLSFDSLFIKSFDGNSDYTTLYSSKFSNEVVFRNKNYLQPGIYLITGDSIIITELIISDNANQNIKIFLNNSDIKFENSPENSANIEYQKKIEKFEEQFTQLDKKFKEIQKQGLPQYLMQTIVDSLVKQTERITTGKTNYQQAVIREYTGTLFASVVKTKIAIPHPPQHYFQNLNLLHSYHANHFFDNYPWDDLRLLNTRIPTDKFKSFAILLYQMDEKSAEPFLKDALAKSHFSPRIYQLVFDNFEKILGSQSSPFWTEYLYIIMLRDALEYPNTAKNKMVRYEKELSLLNKNLSGSQVPNFHILLSNGDTTDLYNINSEYLILYLQNPDCPTCIEIRNKLQHLESLNKAIDNKKITFLTVYFEQNEALWRSYLSSNANPRYLHGWNYLNEIESGKLFDTRVIPYMFLLDKEKKVIRKDIFWNEIDDYIKRLKINN